MLMHFHLSDASFLSRAVLMIGIVPEGFYIDVTCLYTLFHCNTPTIRHFVKGMHMLCVLPMFGNVWIWISITKMYKRGSQRT